MTQVLRIKYAGDVTPKEAWDILENDGKSILIDCRTDAEWSYVGSPNLSQIAKKPIKISWKVFPEMDINPEFQTEITAACPDKEAKLLFLCRSGVRSIDAAISATEAGYKNAYNILEGFEGDQDDQGHRGRLGGWRFSGLPWKQG